jgi:hypothetical protein
MHELRFEKPFVHQFDTSRLGSSLLTLFAGCNSKSDQQILMTAAGRASIGIVIVMGLKISRLEGNLVLQKVIPR